MKITICGSMSFYKKMRSVKKALEQHGHVIFVPLGTDEESPVEGRPGITKGELIATKIE